MVAFRRNLGWCLAALIAVLPLASGVQAVEKQDRRPLPLRSNPQPRIEDGPRFFTIRDVIHRQAGKGPLFPMPHTGLHFAGPLDTTAPLERLLRHPFASRGFEMFSSTNDAIAAQWIEVQSRWNREKRILETCEQSGRCLRSAGILASIRRQASELSDMDRLNLVNSRVNAAIRYRSDWSQHGLDDLWSAPLESLGRAGDCEDYVIAKYFVFRELGVPDDDLRIVLVKDRRAREDHAVLAVRAAFGWHLLDNRNNAIESDQNMPHYRPMFALNSQRLEMFAAPYAELDEAEFKGAILPASAAEPGEEAEPQLDLRGVLN